MLIYYSIQLWLPEEKFISIIIKLRRTYFPKLKGTMEITILKFDNYEYQLFRKDIMVSLYCTKPRRSNKPKLQGRNQWRSQRLNNVETFFCGEGSGAVLGPQWVQGKVLMVGSRWAKPPRKLRENTFFEGLRYS